MTWNMLQLPRFRIKLPLSIQTEAEAHAWMETEAFREQQVRGVQRSIRGYLYEQRRADRESTRNPPRKRRG